MTVALPGVFPDRSSLSQLKPLNLVSASPVEHQEFTVPVWEYTDFLPVAWFTKYSTYHRNNGRALPDKHLIY